MKRGRPARNNDSLILPNLTNDEIEQITQEFEDHRANAFIVRGNNHCIICNHPDRKAITREILACKGFFEIARRYRFDHTATIMRHYKAHLEPIVTQRTYLPAVLDNTREIVARKLFPRNGTEVGQQKWVLEQQMLIRDMLADSMLGKAKLPEATHLYLTALARIREQITTLHEAKRRARTIHRESDVSQVLDRPTLDKLEDADRKQKQYEEAEVHANNGANGNREGTGAPDSRVGKELPAAPAKKPFIETTATASTDGAGESAQE